MARVSLCVYQAPVARNKGGVGVRNNRLVGTGIWNSVFLGTEHGSAEPSRNINIEVKKHGIPLACVARKTLVSFLS